MASDGVVISEIGLLGMTATDVIVVIAFGVGDVSWSRVRLQSYFRKHSWIYQSSRIVQWHPLWVKHTYSQTTLETSVNAVDYHILTSDSTLTANHVQQTLVIFKKFPNEYSTANTYTNESNHSWAHCEHNWHCFHLVCTEIYVRQSGWNQGFVQGSIFGETFIVSDLAVQSQHIFG